MRFTVALALLGLLFASTEAAVGINSGENEKTSVFFFPSFKAITSIDFDQILRADMARESRERRERREQELSHLAMKRSIAIGRAGFRPGKRALDMGHLPTLSMILFNH